jgi:hypothetical protein
MSIFGFSASRHFFFSVFLENEGGGDVGGETISFDRLWLLISLSS